MNEQQLTLEERLYVQEYLMLALIGAHADDMHGLRKMAACLSGAIAGAEQAGTLSKPVLDVLNQRAQWLSGLHLPPGHPEGPLNA